jgi:hypothetical protein
MISACEILSYRTQLSLLFTSKTEYILSIEVSGIRILSPSGVSGFSVIRHDNTLCADSLIERGFNLALEVVDVATGG